MRLDGTPKEITVSDGLPSTVTAMSWQGDEIYGTGTWPGKSTTTRMTLLDHNHYKHAILSLLPLMYCSQITSL